MYPVYKTLKGLECLQWPIIQAVGQRCKLRQFDWANLPREARESRFRREPGRRWHCTGRGGRLLVSLLALLLCKRRSKKPRKCYKLFLLGGTEIVAPAKLQNRQSVCRWSWHLIFNIQLAMVLKPTTGVVNSFHFILKWMSICQAFCPHNI